MAFFDSPKNKALWDKELANLRPERNRREADGFPPAKKRAEMERHKNDIPGRVQINLEKLLEYVKQEAGVGGPTQISAQRARAKAALAKSRGEKVAEENQMAPPTKQAPELSDAVRVLRPKRPNSDE